MSISILYSPRRYNAAVLLVRYPLAAVVLLSVLLLGLSLTPSRRQAVEGINVDAPWAGLDLAVEADLPLEISPGSQGNLVLMVHSQPTGPDGTASALLVASLDSNCLTATPPGDSMQLAQAGQTQTWSWRVDAPQGNAPCLAAVRLSVKPAGEGAEKLLFVKNFEVRPFLVLGLPARVAQVAGFLGLGAGLLGLGAIELRGRLAGRRQRV